VIVRSSYLPGTGTVYQANRDYVIDASAGTIARTVHSRIPDFASNILYGKKDFDQNQFPGYGNTKFFIYVDYAYTTPIRWAEPVDAAALLKKTAEKLRNGIPLKIIAFGDSITAGGEASSPELQYPSLYVQYLLGKFPRAKITLENGATGGDNTVMGLARLNEKVLDRHPDLVLVAFGMNDHNLPGVGGVEPHQFQLNLEQIVRQIQDKTGADVILLSTFPPNPDWHFSSHRMQLYADATKQAAQNSRVAYAEVYSIWQKVLTRKDPPSLLGNNINHPNDFGHWLYLKALQALRF
jgi:lysophospholipase L1-like esterase